MIKASRYASSHSAIENYDLDISTEPDDADVIYFSTWQEAEARAMQMARHARGQQSLTKPGGDTQTARRKQGE